MPSVSSTVPYETFWSYVRKDNENDGDRIKQLAGDIAAEYELLSGDKLELFLDIEEIKWGQDWRKTVDGALAAIAFFVPVITPAFFNSAQCRRELQTFADSAEAIGLRELILPLIYVNVPALSDDSPADPLVALVKTYNWYSWTALRLADRMSSEYRTGVNALATRLVEATSAAQSTPISIDTTADEDTSDETLGTLDKMALLEETLPAWNETLESLSEQVVIVGDIGSSATARIEKANENVRPMAARLTVMRQLAGEFTSPADKILALGATFAEQLSDVDQGVTTIIAKAPQEIADDPSSKSDVQIFFRSISDLVSSAREGLAHLRNLAETIEPIESLSKDLRPPMRTIRKGLTLAYEGLGFMQGWQNLIDETGIDY